MGNKEGSRKEWVKNVLIIFLVVLLILTFFSNTIMNYSLAEVSSAYITNGSISTAIKGTGTIQGVDPYEVVLPEGRKIESVLVRKGDSVSKGDVLFRLEEGTSTEAEEAKKNYEALQTEYQMTIIDNKISQDIVKAAQDNDQTLLNDKMSRLEQVADNLKAKERVLADIEAQMSVLGVTIVDTKNEKAQLEAANTNLEAARTTLNDSEQKVAEYEAAISGVQNDFFSLPEEEQALQQAEVVSKLVALAALKDEAKTKYDAAKADVSRYEEQIKSLEKIISDKESAPSNQNSELAYKRAVAANDKDAVQKQYDELYGEIKYQMELREKLDNIEAKKEEYEKLVAKSIGNEVTAPVSGLITDVRVVAGEKADAQSTLAVIQLSGKDYILEMPVSKEQAARVRVGDVGKASNSWYYNDMTLVVNSIKPDTSNPSSGNRIVVFTVTGTDITVGQQVTVSVGDKSANYDMVVPNNAIREDKNGTYVLLISSKSTPLGNRYTATRVDVTKLASDETNTAISCGLYSYDSVITTSTKPVAPGDQVRLPN